MYRSQFPKIDPYDWFCGPGSQGCYVSHDKHAPPPRLHSCPLKKMSAWRPWLWCLWSLAVSPMQLPRASWMNPSPHCTLGRQRNEPAVFWHSSCAAQLWVPLSHSSMSETTHRTPQVSYMQLLLLLRTIHVNDCYMPAQFIKIKPKYGFLNHKDCDLSE